MSYLLVITSTVLAVVLIAALTVSDAVHARETGKRDRMIQKARSQAEREDANRRFLLGLPPVSANELPLPARPNPNPKSKPTPGGAGLSL